MKNALWTVLAVSLLLACATVAGALEATPAAVDAPTLADTGEYVPFWIATTQAICFPDQGPMTCTSTRDCQLYFGSHLVCDNPSGARCAGACV